MNDRTRESNPVPLIFEISKIPIHFIRLLIVGVKPNRNAISSAECSYLGAVRQLDARNLAIALDLVALVFERNTEEHFLNEFLSRLVSLNDLGSIKTRFF